jgi:predicted metal-binding transcription factor (methanogenesis marker protein 9)
MLHIDGNNLRDLSGWKDAPIPICMGGDYRALTFCCKPGFSLTFAFKCRRDEVLRELNISAEDFIKIKEEFSKENSWDSEIVCFGSISYCCMRRNGCPRRDVALKQRYPKKSVEEFMEIYFQKKKELSKKILESIKDPRSRKIIKPYLLLF